MMLENQPKVRAEGRTMNGTVGENVDGQSVQEQTLHGSF